MMTRYRDIQGVTGISKDSFSSKMLLIGGLMLGGCAGKNAPPIQQPIVKINPLEYNCAGRLGRSEKNDDINVGITPRASYKIHILELSTENVKADISVPVMATDGYGLISFGVRFNGVVFSRRSLVSAIENVCSDVDDLRRKSIGEEPVYKAEKGSSDLYAKTASIMISIDPDPLNSVDLTGILVLMLNTGSINRALSLAALMQSGQIGNGVDAAKFDVESSSEKEYTLKTRTGKQVFKLDKRLDLGIDSASPNPGYMSVPLLINQLSVEKDEYKIYLEMDCNRDVDIRFRGIFFHGPDLSCKKDIK